MRKGYVSPSLMCVDLMNVQSVKEDQQNTAGHPYDDRTSGADYPRTDLL